MRLLMPVLALLALCACSVTQPTPPKQTWLLAMTRPDTAAPAPAVLPTLKVSPFSVVSPYQGKSLVYRDGDVRFAADYYNEWIASPAAMVTDRATTWLAKSGVFAKVFPATSALDGNLELEGIVSELYGDYRIADKPQAVVAIQFHLSDGNSGALYYDQLLRVTAPLRERTPEALARGMDDALAQVMTRLESDLRALKLPAR